MLANRFRLTSLESHTMLVEMHFATLYLDDRPWEHHGILVTPSLSLTTGHTQYPGSLVFVAGPTHQIQILADSGSHAHDPLSGVVCFLSLMADLEGMP